MFSISKKPEDFTGGQWLRFRVPNAGGPGSIPGQGIRFHMSQLKIPCATLRPHASK